MNSLIGSTIWPWKWNRQSNCRILVGMNKQKKRKDIDSLSMMHVHDIARYDFSVLVPLSILFGG